MKKLTKPSSPQPKQQGNQSNIPQEVHQEASRVAKNLFRLPPNPKKK